MDRYIQYEIIRFRPFPETGEFANVGILALDPDDGGLQYKLVPKRFRRVTQFFNTLEPNTFAAAMSLLQDELERVAPALRGSSMWTKHTLGSLMNRDRESVWTFSEPRTVRVEGDTQETIEKLYELYVGRNFVNSDYQERFMVRATRHLLKRRGIEGYSERVVDDEIVPVKFPLVSDFGGTRVIKPISLSQKTTIGVIDHAATWHDRLRLLIKRGRLDNDKILLPISGPSSSDPDIVEAYRTARGELQALDVRVIDQEDEVGLLAFARLGAKPWNERMHY